MPPLYQPGQTVRMRANPARFGTINGQPQRMGDSWSYYVQFNDGQRQSAFEPDLVLVENLDPHGLWMAGSFADHNSLLRLVTWTRLSQAFTDTLLTRFANRIDFEPYQWIPLLKFLDNPQSRILIADEVGLGKTIEAGIIARELTARLGRLRKVLVIGRKGSLNSQWHEEFKKKFSFEFDVWEAQHMQDWLEIGRANKYWADMTAIIGRHTLSNSPNLYESLKGICTNQDGNQIQFSHPKIDLDLLIVDESHHTRNSATNLHEAVLWLAQCAKSVVFLTATPIHLGNDDLYNQLRILMPKRFFHQELFQSELDVHQKVIKAIRQVFAQDRAGLEISLDSLAGGEDISDILTLLDKIEKPAARAELKGKIETFSPLSNVIQRTTRRNLPTEWHARRAITLRHPLTDQEQAFYQNLLTEHYQAIQGGIPFGKSMKLRLAATCMPIAMTAYNLREKENGDQQDESSDERDETSVDIDEMDLNRLSALPDSRFDVLMEALRTVWEETPNSKIIVFSFFVDVLRYLSRRLTHKSISHTVAYGRGMNQEEREAAFTRFLNPTGNIMVLLCSEIGSEGLNLQEADTIINYNLPWNPMVVEQRIGRIDRRGQRAKVIRIVNLFGEGTIEDSVLWRLWERIKIFETSIGDLEPILGGVERVIAQDFANPNLTDKQRQDRAELLAGQWELERANQRRLEEAARETLIADVPFDPVNELISEGRYITAEQIKLLVKGFLVNETPDSHLFENGHGTFTITIAQDLLNVIGNELRGGDHSQEESRRMNMAIGLRSFRLTFDAGNQEALSDSAIEFVAPGHWLVRAVCRALEARRESLHPVSALKCRTARVSPGFYAYGLYVMNLTGLRERKSFEPVFLSLQDYSFIPPDDSQTVLNTILVRSDSLDVRTLRLEYDPNRCLEKIRENFRARYTKDSSEFEKETERHKRIRRQAEQKYANAAIKRIRDTIDGLVTEEQRRILPALEQNIRNLESRRDATIAELDGKQVSAAFNEIGFGLLKVEG